MTTQGTVGGGDAMSMNQQIREFLEKNPTPWRAKKVAEQLGLDANLASIGMSQMRVAGELVGCKVEVPGERPQFEYRIAAASSRTKGSMRKWSLGHKQRAAKGATTPAADAEKPKRKYRKRKGAKVQPRTAKRQRQAARPNDRSPAREPMWALRSDGAFILLGEDLGLVIPRAAALALVAFVRTLDKGQG